MNLLQSPFLKLERDHFVPTHQACCSACSLCSAVVALLSFFSASPDLLEMLSVRSGPPKLACRCALRPRKCRFLFFLSRNHSLDGCASALLVSSAWRFGRRPGGHSSRSLGRRPWRRRARQGAGVRLGPRRSLAGHSTDTVRVLWATGTQSVSLSAPRGFHRSTMKPNLNFRPST